MTRLNQFALAAWMALLPGWAADRPLVINEIHYNPDVTTERVEFIELFNAGTNAVDVGGWFFSSGLNYVFPATNVAPGGYLVVAQDPAALAVKFPGTVALGPFNPDRSSGLSKYGEKITLCNAAGQVMDEVNYQPGFPWPTVGDPPGYSIELIHPKLDNDLGGSWRASVSGGGTQQAALLIQTNSVWKYFKGVSEASAPATLWRQLNFDDSNWLTNQTPMGYGETWLATTLADMPTNYLSVFFRKTFVVSDPTAITSLLLEAQYDDGFKVWINGVNVYNANISTNELPFDGAAGPARESANLDLFTLNNPGYLLPGTNVIAIQAHNTCLSPCSSDFFLDIRLRAQVGPAGRGPTPGKLNSVYATNAPPQIRQADHSPNQPLGGQPVKVTAKVTDPDGVASVQLQYQIVAPGNYIELTDSAYTNAANWITAAMNDSGADGDEAAGDDVYTATIPAAVQAHRRLIRYRITVADTLGASVRVPYADDPQPNFAYFVYNGVPAWQGAIQPGAAGSNGAVHVVASNEMSRLPAYHLIGKSSTIAQATWLSRYSGDLYQWAGTLVYDGKVYDHIHYRARGGVWRYSMVKNMWKFDMNRGHDFEARDNRGKKYKTAWTKLNLGACIQQGDFWHRGEQGMFESVGLRLFQLAGVTAPHTSFVTFRVIDDALEADPATQFEGDFWGVYLAVEQENGRFLEEHDLPDSNFYKMEGGTGTLNNQGPNDPGNKTDLNYILNNYTGATENWWRTNWNLAKYYSYQSIVQGIHHYDICYDKNFFYYYNPSNRLWELMPWDLDLTWANNMFDSGCGGKDRVYQRVIDETNPAKPGIALEYRNRVREVRDLLFNTEQAHQLIDEYAFLLRGASNALTILDADRCQWDYNPKMISSTYTPNLNKAQQGYYYQWTQEPAVSKSFDGCIQLMKNYIGTRSAILDATATDALKPNRPTIAYTGSSNYPINRLTFRSSAFSSGGAAFRAIKWRIAEVSDYSIPPRLDPEPRKYEITAAWESGELTNFNADISLPSANLRAGQRYRVRVQHVDTTGRTSNWSLPVEFITAPPDNTYDLMANLRITEIMYHPAAGGAEFIELYNSSPGTTLDLSGVQFTKGIEFIFPPGLLLAPGAYLVVANTADLAGFRAYYGVPPSVAVLGPFTRGSLDNNGEQITLSTPGDSTNIVSFTYGDGRGWPLTADGAGHSLVLQNSALAAEDITGNYGGNWRASTYLRGSAGRAEPPMPAGLLLNEIAANTGVGPDSNDWIELYNPTADAITLPIGWYLSDDPTNLTKWMIPAGTVLPAQGWAAVDEITGFHNPTNIGFGIDKDGEQILLSYLPGTTEDRIVDAVQFKGQEAGWSWGRYPDGASWWQPLSLPTRQAANQMGMPELVITEIHYHPIDIGGTNDNTADEFIEIKNVTAHSVDLSNTNGPWRLDGEAAFAFPPSVTVTPGGTLLIVNFNPYSPADWDAFTAKFPIANSNLVVFGPYGGKLANSSGRVALEKPQATDQPGVVSWVVVDEVLYADYAPWPCGTDGEGNSLQRVNPAKAGNDPYNWAGQYPTPGQDRPPTAPGVAAFVTQPMTRVVPTNANVSFSVSLCGIPPYAYQWYFNGNSMSGQTNAELLLTNVQVGAAGDYTVVVTNDAGAVTSAVATLTVQYPPSIAVQPQSQVVTGYTTAYFTVMPTGTLPFQFQWRLNGVPIADATNRTLVLLNVQGTQAGSYSVLVQNTAGSVLSSNATLTVNLPAKIIVQPSDVKTTNGFGATFSVNATGPGLSYQWYYNTQSIVGATGTNLLLTNVTLSLEGFYSVVVSNQYGVDTSRPAFLKVLLAPSYTVNPTNQTVTIGSEVTFTATVIGSQPLRMRWDFLGAPVPGFGFDRNSDTLVLPGIHPGQAGFYRATATNELKPGGVGSSLAFLAVVSPPADAQVLQGSDITLRAQVAGFTLAFQWFFNETAIAGATSTNLVLTNVVPSQAGVYKLMVKNNSLTNYYPLILTVQSSGTPPEILEAPTNRVVLTNGNTVFAVNAAGTDPLSYQWYRNGTNLLTNALSRYLVLTNLQPAQVGPYQVVVTNAFGAVTSAPAFLSLQASTNRVKLDLLLSHDVSASQALFQFGAEANQSYTVQYRDGFGTNLWLRFLDVTPALTNRQIGVTNNGSAPIRFFRIASPQLP